MSRCEHFRRFRSRADRGDDLGFVCGKGRAHDANMVCPVPRRSVAACFTRSAIEAFREGEIRARIIGLLVANLAVHLQHAIVVLEHVPRHGPGERILHVGIDVHFHHAVVERLVDLRLRRAGAAVEDEMKPRFLAVRLHHCILAFLQHARPQFHVAGLVDSMDVAERGREEVASADRD